jgi:P-type Ca2+ transporter type 2C
MVKFEGLKQEEAEKILKRVGPNELKEINKISPLKIILNQIKKNSIIYLLVFAMILSFLVKKNLTAYTILLVIFVVVFVGFLQEYKAEKAIHALKEMIVSVSVVIRNGREQEISTKELVPGDIIILRNGEKIPADCIILEEKELYVNESVLTGESKEVKKHSTKNENDYEDENLLFTGSFIVGGKSIAKVISTGMNTRFGKIAGMISTAEKELPLQKKVNRIAKYMAIAGGSFSLLTGLIMLIKTPGINMEIVVDALMIVIAVSVASFPEGFPVVLITSLASGSYRMAQKNAIVNRMSIIETLGETTVICSDKTGTITRGEMTVKEIHTSSRKYRVSGVGYAGSGEFFSQDKKVNIEKEESLKTLIKTAVLCNDSSISRTGEGDSYHFIGNPTESSLLIMGVKANIFKEEISSIRREEIPFSSERKMMTILSKEGKDNFVYSKGAFEILIEKCKYVKKENGIFKLLERDKKRLFELNKEMTLNSMRVMAFAYKEANSSDLKENLEKELIFLGLVGMEDPPRKGVKEAIDICKKAGIKVKMITGDNKETAISIAKQIGLERGSVIEGKQIDLMTDSQLFKVVHNAVVFARVKPEHKIRIVRALKKRGEIVTMTGDGVNDAPALKEAHIGVAMGKNGTDVSRSAADLTLKDDNFSTIVDAITEGRTIFTNIQKFTTYQISINFSQVALIFFAILFGLPLPLVAIQILFMNLFSDELVALTLAFNPYSKDVMSSEPRKKSSIITKPLFIMMAVSGMIMSLGSLLVFYFVLSLGKSLIAARTITFMTMVFFGIANAFNFRSFRKLTLTRSPLTNKPLLLASIFTIVSTIFIIYSPLNKILGTTLISVKYLLIGFLVSLSVIFIFDFIKYLNEKKHFWSEDMQSLRDGNKSEINSNLVLEKIKSGAEAS